ncbi:uncharacterized protein LOC114353608 [Ostrinia furnacalis]|uniref:uncharacterized protein LOC114353608 n=1 Tax=Ostrinia furnacalis TaxID=93504 RepID=UPI00104088E5|nr:uncharacterized protein LOC114353608 [Ostrinia furnacalis]
MLMMIDKETSFKLQNEADLQSSLMPQELNPAFIANKDEPWRAIMPVPRLRRDLEPHAPSFTSQLQRYSRVTACAVLALAAVVEIVLYVLDYYLP